MSQSGGLGRKAEILLVEDNPDDVDFTRLAFQNVSIDHDLHVARNGDEALEFLADARKPRPDLILLDLNMPRKDGHATLFEVKQHSEWRRIPVVILTTSDAPEDLERTYNGYANAYLTKRMDLDDWFAMVESTVEFWLRWNVPAP